MKWKKIILLSLLCLIASGCINSGPQKFEIKWSGTYGGEKNDLACSFQSTSDGFIIAGTSNSFNEEYDSMLIKTDKDGNEIWKKTFETPGYDIIFFVHPTSDEGYTVFGMTESLDKRSYTIWQAEIDKTGDKIQSKTIEIEENFAIGSILQTSDGYVLVGTTQYSYPEEGAVMIMKVSKDGTEVYKKTLDIEGHDVGKSIKQASDGGYIIAGSIATVNNYPIQNALLVKTDKDFKVEWTKTYSYSDKDWLLDLQVVSGGYVAVGYTSMKDDAYLGYGGDYMLIKTDKNGEEVWMKTYGHNISETPTKHVEYYMEDYAFSLLTVHDGYILIGYAFTDEEGSPAIFLVKTDEEGTVICEHLYEEDYFGGPVIKTGKDEFVLLANTWDLENSDIVLMKITAK